MFLPELCRGLFYKLALSIMSSAYRKMVLPSVDPVVTRIARAMGAPVSLTTHCVLLVAAATTPFVEMCLMLILEVSNKEVEGTIFHSASVLYYFCTWSCL